MLIFRRRVARLWLVWPWELAVFLGLLMGGAPEMQAAPPVTTIQDTIFNADGSPFTGVLYVSWPSFTASDTSVIGAQTLTVQVTAGYLNLQLVPTTTAQPQVTYTVLYDSGGKNQYTETWAVPPSSTPLRIQEVRIASTGNVNNPGPPPLTATFDISQVIGLESELTLRPVMGTGFAVSRAAVIDALGDIDGASGNVSDCVHVDGTSGPCGSATSSVMFSDNEVPSGTINGTNAVFTLANAPAPASSLSLFRNGMLLRPSVDYTLNAAAVTFSGTAIPQAGDYLQASYRYGGTLSGVTFVDQETPGGTANGTNVTFTLANTPNPSTSLALYRNGLRMMPGVDYTLSGSTITFAAASTPQTGDILIASYRM